MVSRLRYFEKKEDKKVAKKPINLKKKLAKALKEQKLGEKKFFDIIKKRQRNVKKKEDEKLSYAEQLAKVEVLKRKDEERKKQAERYFVKIDNPLLKLEAELKELELEKEKLLAKKKDRRSKEYKDITRKIEEKEDEIEKIKEIGTPGYILKQEAKKRKEEEAKKLAKMRREILQSLPTLNYFKSKTQPTQDDIVSFYDKAAKAELELFLEALPKIDVVFADDPTINHSLITDVGLQNISDAYDVIMTRVRTAKTAGEAARLAKEAAEKTAREAAKKEQEKYARLYSEVIGSPEYTLYLYNLSTSGDPAQEEAARRLKIEIPSIDYANLKDFYDNLLSGKAIYQNLYAKKKTGSKSGGPGSGVPGTGTGSKSGGPGSAGTGTGSKSGGPGSASTATGSKSGTGPGSIYGTGSPTTIPGVNIPDDIDLNKMSLPDLKILIGKFDKSFMKNPIKQVAVNKLRSIRKSETDKLKAMAPPPPPKTELDPSDYPSPFKDEFEALLTMSPPLDPTQSQRLNDFKLEPQIIDARFAPLKATLASGSAGLDFKNMMKKHKKVLSTISQDPKTHSIILGMASVHNKKYPKSMHMTIKYIIKQMKKGKVKNGKLHFKI